MLIACDALRDDVARLTPEAPAAGEVRFVDLVEGETVSEELDELTGLRQRVVIEDREKKLHPHIEIWQTKGGKEKKVRDFVIPVGAQLIIEDGADVAAGQTIAKISRKMRKRFANWLESY